MKSTEVAINSTLSEIFAKLGQPKKESEYYGYKILWYDSLNPFKADIFYLQNDELVLRSYPADDKITLSQYIDQSGRPEISVSYYSGEFLKKDSFETTLHLWPNRGFDVVSYGAGSESVVFLIRTYRPMTIEEYFSGVGSEFARNQVVTLLLDQQPEAETKQLQRLEVIPELTASQSSALFWELGLGRLVLTWVAIGLIVLLVLTGASVFLFRRFRRKLNNEPLSPPPSSPLLS